jgi:hypothetical protein
MKWTNSNMNILIRSFVLWRCTSPLLFSQFLLVSSFLILAEYPETDLHTLQQHQHTRAPRNVLSLTLCKTVR